MTDFNSMSAEQKLTLALKACLYAAATNKKQAGATYVWDFKKKHGGPYTIPFDDAIGIVAEFIEGRENPEARPDTSDDDGQFRIEEDSHD